MNLNERISKIIEYSELTSSEFADEIEVQRSSISHITSGRNKPSLDFLIKVKEKFPELNWDWLILGNGEMLMNSEEKTEAPPKNIFPDLFALIDDDQFGRTESEDKVQKQIPRESVITVSNPIPEKIDDSQQLAEKEFSKTNQVIENQKNKIKRIVLFFENGKFESFES